MPLTPAYNQGGDNWQRIMGAPRDYSEDAVRGMQVASKPFEMMQEQQKISDAQRHNQAIEGLTASEQAETARRNQATESLTASGQAETSRHNTADELLTAANRALEAKRLSQQQDQFTQEQALRNNADQRAQVQSLHDQIMGPVQEAQGRANLLDTQYKAQQLQLALQNNGDDTKALLDLGQKYQALTADDYTNGNALKLYQQSLSGMKTQYGHEQAQGLYNSGTALYANKAQLTAKTHFGTAANNAYQAVIDAGGNESQAMSAGVTAQLQDAKANGVIPSGYHNAGGGPRALRDNETDLQGKPLLDSTTAMLSGLPQYQDKYGQPDPAKIQGATNKLNLLIHGTNGQLGDPGAAREYLSDPQKLQDYLNGKYNQGNGQTQTDPTQSFFQSYGLTKPPDSGATADGSPAQVPVTAPTPDQTIGQSAVAQPAVVRPGQTASSSTAPGEVYHAPPAAPTPPKMQAVPSVSGGTGAGMPMRRPPQRTSQTDDNSGLQTVSNDTSGGSGDSAAPQMQLSSGQPTGQTADAGPGAGVGGWLRAMAYGPSQGEFTHDTLNGPLGALQKDDIALSPNQLKNFPLGSYVNAYDTKGNVYRNQRVADYSYISKGNPTKDSMEFWNGEDHGHVRLEAVPTPGQTGQKQSQSQPQITTSTDSDDADGQASAIPTHPQTGHYMPTSPQQAMTLPGGTPFMDPTGQLRMVPTQVQDQDSDV